MAVSLFPLKLLLLLLLLIAFFSVHNADQLQSSQSQSLVKIHQLLNYPSALSSFNHTSSDFCSIEPTSTLTLSCYEGDITQIHIIGNNGFPPLPQDFSIDSLFATLENLTSLKVLSFVSLGLWGPIPSNIAHLTSLEILNVSSNYFYGSIPTQLLGLRNLQTLILDHNNFTGLVPDWLSSLPELTVLSLKNNAFSGPLPKSLGTLPNLRVVILSENNFSGEVPNLRKLKNLQVVDLEDNHFGPHFPSLPKKLASLVLRKNSFHLGLSKELETHYQLQKLDLSLNGFVGPFLPSIFTLPSLSYLDISGNKFTGKLFHNMTCSSELNFVNLSSNLLTGQLPTCLKLRSKHRIVLFDRNCLSNKEQEQHPSNFCHTEALAVEVIITHRHNKHETRGNKAVVASSVVGGMVGIMTIVGFASMLIKKMYYKERVKRPVTRLITENGSTTNTAKLLSDAKYISETMKLGASLPAYRSFSLEELKEFTSNFDASNLMGEGSNGQCQTYKGKLPDGRLVAIKSLKMRKKNNLQFYRHHIELISKLRHYHLVSALGHCLECQPDDSIVSQMFIIFEFVPNGTLRGCISAGKTPGQKLTWTQRISAAIGVAKGIQFLHTGIVPGIFSNNLKITDVLMDHNLHVKISRFNLPLLAENRGILVWQKFNYSRNGVSSSSAKGSTHARINHEDKNDVYDIGVILLEIILGRPIMFENEVGLLKDLLRVSTATDETARRSIVDPAVHKECSDESLKTMMEICLRCLSNEPTDRPSVEDILWNLQFAIQVQELRKSDSPNNEDLPVLTSTDV